MSFPCVFLISIMEKYVFLSSTSLNSAHKCFLCLWSHRSSVLVSLLYTPFHRGNCMLLLFFSLMGIYFTCHMATSCDRCSLQLVFLVTSLFAGSLPGEFGHSFFFFFLSEVKLHNIKCTVLTIFKGPVQYVLDPF